MVFTYDFLLPCYPYLCFSYFPFSLAASGRMTSVWRDWYLESVILYNWMHYFFFLNKIQVHTFDLQFAGDHSFTLSVLGSAGVHTTIKAAGLADLQWADALIRNLAKLGVISNKHLIFQPLNLGLQIKWEKLI